uniref:uncharacterized protein LOC122608860 n=1 Tax=Erigeron canadensis TaxID=72917 RepID=UPI001CB989D0|nr:uncharacterized protein LOC122608860 [Erigeron canadensis]
MANKTHKSFFMPMLCRFSLNDTVKPTRLHETSSSHDPSSPKLSCTGQIKKRSNNNEKNNNNTHFMASRLSASTNSRSSAHYTKLYKLLSGKNLISPAIDTTFINNPNNKCVTKRSKSCNDRARIPISTKSYSMTSSVVLAQELDPPLPVVKYDHRDKKGNVNLCKRRGLEMKTLQIQPIQVTIDQNNVATNNNNAAFLAETSATTL